MRFPSTDSSSRGGGGTSSDEDAGDRATETALTRQASSSSLTLSSPTVKLKTTRSSNSHHRSIWWVRFALLFFLVLAASVLGFLAHHIVKGSERALAETQYEALVERALTTAAELSVRRRVVGKSMASVAAAAFPNASQWPNVAIPAFERFAADLVSPNFDQIELGFYPLVLPEDVLPGQQAAFEKFAYKYFYVDRSPPFSNDTAVHRFGRGVYMIHGNHPRHDTTGRSYKWKSPNRVLFPTLQKSLRGIKGRLHLLLNIHAVERLGAPLDDVIACSRQRQVSKQLSTDCSAETTIFSTKRASWFIQPIYPAADPYELTGVIVSRVSWDIIMNRMFEQTFAQAPGLTAVLQTQGHSFAYSLDDNGQDVVFRKDGFQQQQQDDEAAASGSNLLLLHQYSRTKLLSSGAAASARQYSLTLTPTPEFFDVYTTANPHIAMAGAVLIVICTSAVFVVYDCTVQREFNAKRNLLQAKKKFVRFISHEVRTPLNAVCMGLTLLQDDIKALQKKRCRHWDDARPGGDGVPAVSSSTNSSSTTTRTQQEDLDLRTWLSLLEDTHESSSSTVECLSDLLNFDKVETGTLALELSVFSIWDVVMDATKDFCSLAKNKEINFQLDSSTPPMSCEGRGEDNNNNNLELAEDGRMNLPSSELQQSRVVGDRIRITQSMQKLVKGALRFTPNGGTVTIRTSFFALGEKNDKRHPPPSSDVFTLNSGEEVTCERTGFVQVDVIDSGPGLSQEQLSVLGREGVEFDVNELRAGQAGSLGLFVSKGIMLQHGGRIHVSSSGLGLGTTFSIMLPVHRVPGFTCEIDPLPSGPVEEHSTSNGGEEEEEPLQLHVLVVDDSATNRKLLARLVRNQGHSTVEARDGQEAVEKVVNAFKEGNQFDSILMDWEMPQLSGPEATQRIRELGHSGTFIVGVTGNVNKEDVDHFLSCGADAVLPKPVDMKRLGKLWLDKI